MYDIYKATDEHGKKMGEPRGLLSTIKKLPNFKDEPPPSESKWESLAGFWGGWRFNPFPTRDK